MTWFGAPGTTSPTVRSPDVLGPSAEYETSAAVSLFAAAFVAGSHVLHRVAAPGPERKGTVAFARARLATARRGSRTE